ncbi:glycoside hydrolase family 16 protein [Flavobacterium rhizosphaerae]|uniref:Glycoside hydrolase family 16 protein n=1 Tax=Flavobacterium rhizosphaerae TaxID=3163298 RepID=A0ABW8YVN1_9FLAO
MKFHAFRLTALIAGALVVTSATLPEKPTALDEKVIFFEDFSGKEINRNYWTPVITGHVVNNEQQAYVDSTTTLYLTDAKEAKGAKNGALVIKALYSPGFKTKDGQTFDFISGRMHTRDKVQFTYGTVEARIKMPAGSGYWPAFWMLGNGKWPDCGEIDIMEYIGEPDWVSAALHGQKYYGDTPFVNYVYLDDKNDVTQWHVYTVDWQKDQILFKVDGKLYFRVTKPMIKNYGEWAFDNPHYILVNMALGGAYPAKINGVKEPYYGLPQSTVNDIIAGNGKTYIDWIKVTQKP